MPEIGHLYWTDYSDCDSDCLNTTLWVGGSVTSSSIVSHYDSAPLSFWLILADSIADVGRPTRRPTTRRLSPSDEITCPAGVR